MNLNYQLLKLVMNSLILNSNNSTNNKNKQFRNKALIKCLNKCLNNRINFRIFKIHKIQIFKINFNKDN